MNQTIRPRRLRNGLTLRKMMRETRMSPDSLILPIFIREGQNIREEIPSLPGQYHYSPDRVSEIAEEALKSGVNALLLFGLPAHKDDCGSESYNPNGALQQGIRILKERYPELYIVTDICMCEYTSHGHCGILSGQQVDNDKTYAVKYASAFYGPFRDAAGSAPAFGDRKGYQMDFHNVREALKEVWLDIEEGADALMVKPALAYLDVIRAVKEETTLPLAAYSVSGEYAMIKAAADRGLIDEYNVMCESAVSIYRAGADILISYYAKELAEAMKKGAIG